jgi:GT2 family glycosyltransferase
MSSKVYVVILNWNGWKDTIECLESLLRVRYDNFQIVICDNDSHDSSLDRIVEWAEGNLAAAAANPLLDSLSKPPVPKPIPIQFAAPPFSPQLKASPASGRQPLVLIRSNMNLGFAGGCNVGLRFALAQPDCDYAWLLNNDTVVDPDSLGELVALMSAKPTIGMAGSTIVEYFNLSQVQAYGGTRYSRWRARTPPLQADSVGKNQILDCVLGCSMLVSRCFMQNVGLMDESYFLYFEELDWAVRAKGRFLLGHAPKSIVYHKEGASIGSSRQRSKRSMLSERFLARNRVLFTKRYYPYLLPSVLSWVLATACHRMLIGDKSRAKAIFAAAIEGLTA